MIDPKKRWNHGDEVIRKDADDWIYDENKKPEEFYLVKLLMKNGYTAMGWRNGNEWCGYKLNSKKVIAWKRSNTLH